MTISGSGYAPHSHVLITSTANVDASATANAAGKISVTVQAPAPSSRPHRSRRSDSPPRTSTPIRRSARPALARIAPLGALHGSTPKAPGLKALTEPTSWSFSGFAPGRTIFAHYTIDGRQVALQAFGTARGACGTLRTRAPLYPATPHHSSYPVQFDSVGSYSRRTTPKITGHVSLNAF